MNISLCTYPWAFDVPGGGERQLLSYYNAIHRGKHKWPSLNVTKFDPWNPSFSKIQVMHYFGCMASSKDFLNHVRMVRGVSLIMSPNFWPDPAGWKKSDVYENIKTILWLSNLVVVNSFIEHEALVRLIQIDSSKISVVPNATDPLFFEMVSPDLFRKEYAVAGKYVLNVANVEPRKNQLAFLKALKSFPALTLITIGYVRDNWYAEACMAEAGSQFRIIPPQEPNSLTLRSAIAGCEFFAMPSLVETPSIASLEAGAAGAKLLTTKLGSTEEYFKDFAIYINPYDIDSMKDGILKTIRSSVNSELQLLIKNNYTWDVIVDQLVEDSYSRVAGYQLKTG